MNTDIRAIHGVVARVIDVPSQQVSYLRIEFPVEHHAEVTALFYGRHVLVVPAGPAMASQPFGVLRAGDPELPAVRAILKPSAKVAGDKPKGGTLCKSAAQICQEQTFIEFAFQNDTSWTGQQRDGSYGSGDAAIFLRGWCGIESRVELDHNPEAARHFGVLMEKYREWREGVEKAHAA